MRRERWLPALALPAALQLAACAAGPPAHIARQEADVVRYTVLLHQPQTQSAEIVMELEHVDAPTLDVALPVWRPGRYVLIDASTTVSHVRAASGDGRTLPIRKLDKSTWQVQTGGASGVRVTYRVYANSINDRTRHIDETHAFLSPSSVFMYAPARRDHPLRVKIDAPDAWDTATGLERTGENEFAAADYDVLVDSPLEIGVHERHTFEVDGVPHEIVIWHAGAAASAPPACDAERMKRDFAAIVRAEAAVFGEMPYRRYVYLVHAGPGLGGGTEHLNSTIMQTSRAALEDSVSGGPAYQRFLGLVSHEMFHTWNVKQLRPADLKPYDYAHEDYSRLLWVAEGTTSYYDDVCLVRAGLMSPGDYLGSVKGMIEGELNKAGWDAQSLEDSSFDAWIKFNKTWADSANTTVSFYSKGALISLLLDMELRTRTGDRVSLDAVMRVMYQRFPLHGPGYTTQDLLGVVNELSESDFSQFFADYVAGTARPDFAAALRVVGLECSSTTHPEEAYLGLNLSEREGRTLVTGVLADGPAYAAGLIADDEVVALDSRRLRAGDLDARLKKHSPGDEVVFTILRREELRTISVRLTASQRTYWTIEKVKDPTDAQRAAYQSWLGVEWDK